MSVRDKADIRRKQGVDLVVVVVYVEHLNNYLKNIKK